MALSYDQRRELVLAAIRPLYTDAAYVWVQDMWDEKIVYSVEDRDPIGYRYFECGYSIVDGAVTLGEATEVVKQTVFVPTANFEIGDGDDGTWVKVFEIGSYPDKNFSLTEEEADKFVGPANIPLKVQHKDTVFTKADPFGVGVVKEFARKGKDILGRVSVASWVKECPALKGREIGLSAGFDRTEKAPKELSLVWEPHIQDAMMAAFEKAQTPERKGPLMNIIDQIKALFGQLTPEEKVEFSKEVGTPAPVAPPAKVEQDADEVAKFAAERDKQTAEIARLQSAARSAIATQLAQHHAGAFGKDAVSAAVALFGKALEADDVVEFSAAGAADGQVKSLIAFMGALPKVRQGLIPGTPVAEFSKGADEGDSDVPFSDENQALLRKEESK